MKRRRKRKKKNEPFFYETDNFIKMLLLSFIYLLPLMPNYHAAQIIILKFKSYIILQ